MLKASFKPGLSATPCRFCAEDRLLALLKDGLKSARHALVGQSWASCRIWNKKLGTKSRIPVFQPELMVRIGG